MDDSALKTILEIIDRAQELGSPIVVRIGRAKVIALLPPGYKPVVIEDCSEATMVNILRSLLR